MSSNPEWGPRVARYIGQWLAGACVVLCIAAVVLTARARMFGDRIRWEGRVGVTAVVHLETAVLRVIGFGPGIDGDYGLLYNPLFYLPALVPLVWLVATRGTPAVGRFGRHFRHLCAASPALWALVSFMLAPVSFLVGFVPPAALVTIVWALRSTGPRTVAQRRREQGVCVNCGYDLRATPRRCPECGTFVVRRPSPPARG